MAADAITVCLAGDVMPGRGVDQILATPGDPALRESWVRDARRYVELAEEVNGPVPRHVGADYVWGDALAPMLAADVRVLNLESALTTSDDFADKGINYRMHPANVGVLGAARPHVCVLANNHVLDFGAAGLAETLVTLDDAGFLHAGAGRDADEAWRPAVLDAAGRRVVLLAVGTASSGIPPSWAATPGRPGVAFLPEPTPAAADRVLERLDGVRRSDDVVVVSVHWGGNWGYEVSASERAFAHRLLAGGVRVVHGHSSHHPRPSQVVADGVVLYGCGDLVDDYEGISGYERYRGDLRLLHLVGVPLVSGRPPSLRMLPFRAVRLRLQRASVADTRWLAETLGAAGSPLGARCEVAPDGTLWVPTG